MRRGAVVGLLASAVILSEAKDLLSATRGWPRAQERRSVGAPLLRMTAANETGYDLWLRYRHIDDARRLAELRRVATELVIAGESPTLRAARDELSGALAAMGAPVKVVSEPSRDGAIIIGTDASSLIRSLPLAADVRREGTDGFVIRSTSVRNHRAIVVASTNDVGAMYGQREALAVIAESRAAYDRGEGH